MQRTEHPRECRQHKKRLRDLPTPASGEAGGSTRSRTAVFVRKAITSATSPVNTLADTWSSFSSCLQALNPFLMAIQVDRTVWGKRPKPEGASAYVNPACTRHGWQGGVR